MSKRCLRLSQLSRSKLDPFIGKGVHVVNNQNYSNAGVLHSVQDVSLEITLFAKTRKKVDFTEIKEVVVDEVSNS